MPSRRTVFLTIDSVLAYTLGYVVAFFVNLVGLMVAGLLAGRKPILYHNEVTFRLAGDDWVYVGGIVLVLIFGLALWSIYRDADRSTALARLVVLWLLLHAVARGLIQLIQLPWAEEGDAAIAADYFGLADGFKWLIAAVALVAFLWMGVLAGRALLNLASSSEAIGGSLDRVVFVAWLAVLPWAAGALLVWPFFTPAEGTGALTGAIPAGLFLIVTILAAWRDENAEPDNAPVAVGWWLVLLLAGIYAVFQYVLVDGINIG